LPIPAQDSVGCTDGRDASEGFAAHGLALGRQSPTLDVGQPKALARKVFLVDGVLRKQVFDVRFATTLKPSSHGEDQEVQRGRFHRGHPSATGRSKTPSACLLFGLALRTRMRNRVAI